MPRRAEAGPGVPMAMPRVHDNAAYGIDGKVARATPRLVAPTTFEILRKIHNIIPVHPEPGGRDVHEVDAVEYSARIMRQGPARSLGCAVLLATLAAWPALARADASTTEYADARYRFTFRFPADWQREKVPTPGEGGEVRLAAKSAARPIFVLAIVSPTGSAITP